MTDGRIEELHAYMTHDENGNEVLLGVNLAGLGLVPLVFKTLEEVDVAAPFAMQVQDKSGVPVFVKRFFRESGS